MHSQAVVIGGGPAGMSCAIGLVHGGVETMLIEQESLGGLLQNAYQIKNLPGFYEATGTDIIKNLKTHLAKLGIKHTQAQVSRVWMEPPSQHLFFEVGGQIQSCSYLVIATGTKPVKIAEFDCPSKTFYHVKDMLHLTGQHIVVIGSGEAALDSALSLAARSNRVTVIGSKIPAQVSAGLLRDVKSHSSIRIDLGQKVDKVSMGQNQKLQVQAGSTRTEADGVLISIGRVPQLDFLAGPEVLASPHVFQCGDVKNQNFRQSVIAMGDGGWAAMKIQTLCHLERAHVKF